jgi:tRNA(Ile)-lysidine synthase
VRSEGELLILRPLLGWSKVELIRLVAEAGLEAIDDPSNRNPRFDRVVVRGYLEDSTLFDPHRLARTAAACREADAALDWMARQLAKERLSTEGGEWRIDISGLPRELRRRLLVHTIKEARREHGLGGRWREGEDVEGLLSALERGGTATRAGLIGIGGPLWRLRPAPPRR